MVLEALWHLGQRLEQARVDRAEVAHDGVGLVDDVVGHGSVVRVGDDLHAVADVVEITVRDAGAAGHQRVEALAVGVAISDGVCVVDPPELAVRDDEIRILVVLEERRDELLALGDVAVEQDAAGGLDLVAEEQVGLAEAQREQEPVPERADADAALARITRAGVCALLRVVELLGRAVHDHVVVGQLAVVDARLVDLRLALRWDVLHQELRTALGRDPAHRRHHRAEAVRELQVAVHPRLLQQGRGVELARRQHDGHLAATDGIAVDIYVGEVVVRPQRLQLIEVREQAVVIPEPHRQRVGELASRLRLTRRVGHVEQRLFDLVERVRGARRRDVPLDVWTLLVQLVGCHDVVLHDRWVHAVDEHGRGEPQHDRARQHPHRSRERVREARQRGDADDERQDRQRGDARVHAREPGAGQHPLGPEEQVVLIEHVSRSDEQQKETAEHGEMRACRSSEGERRPAGDAKVRTRDRARRDADHTAHRVDRDDTRGDHENGGDPPAAHELEDRQREEVEADVPTEEGIGHAERHRVEPAEQLVPLVAARESEEERWDGGHPQEAQRLRERGGSRALLDHHARDLRTEREVEIRQGDHDEDQEERDERPEPGGVTAEVHVLETETAEPQQIGEKLVERKE